MHNIWLVAQHEFSSNIRKKSFLFSVFGVPLLMAGIFAIVFLVAQAAEDSGIVAERIGYVDLANLITVEAPNYIPLEDAVEAQEALQAGTVDLYFVITPFYFSNGNVPIYAADNVSAESKEEIELFLVENLTAGINTDAPSERLIEPMDLEIYLESNQKKLSETAFIGVIVTPFVFSTVLIMALQLTSGFLMSGVVEEKTNRIMEILITSISPYELLTGKLLGIGLLGLLQMLVWIAFGVVGAAFGGQIEFLSGLSFPPEFILIVLLYFFFTYFLYASILAGVGAVVGSEQESRTIAGIVSLFLALPYFAIYFVFTDPESPILTALLLFPMSAAMSYMMLYPFASILLWQVILSLVLLVFSTFAVTWAAARVFRWALLFTGKLPNPWVLWSVIRGKQEIGVVPNNKPKKEQAA
jgi:ABC-2 type transport system permease protein